MNYEQAKIKMKEGLVCRRTDIPYDNTYSVEYGVVYCRICIYGVGWVGMIVDDAGEDGEFEVLPYDE